MKIYWDGSSLWVFTYFISVTQPYLIYLQVTLPHWRVSGFAVIGH